jgi:hypothetical protein
MSLLVKGATVRAHLKWLAKDGKLEAVLQRVPPETAALIRNPPLASTWIDSQVMEPMMCALEELGGKAAILRMSRDELREDLMTPLRPMIAGVLRLFGTSPATIYGRLNDMVKTTVRGMEFKFQSLSERSGSMEVRYDVEREIPTCMFVSCMAALEMVPELCGHRGRVGEPERLGPAVARFDVSW